MVRRNYVGFVKPEYAVKALDELRPFRKHMIVMSDKFFPYSEEWKKVQAVVEAMDALALYFTGDQAFYAIGDSGQIGTRSMPPTDKRSV